MKKTMSLLLLVVLSLFPSSAPANNLTAGSTGTVRGGGAALSSVQTTAAMDLFVETTGSDSNPCTSVGAPCLTIQGAVNKVPKRIRNAVNITVGTGTFTAGAYVDGFITENDLNAPSTGAYLEIKGTLITATVATGTASGTATAGSAGSNPTFGTLTDSGQSWTVNDLRGKLLEITGGTGAGQLRAIQSNTATVITVTGVWTAPTTSSTYVVRDWGTVISGILNQPRANSYTAASSGLGGSFLLDSISNNSGRGVTIQRFKFTGSRGVVHNTEALVEISFCRFETTGTALPHRRYGGLFLSDNSASVANNQIWLQPANGINSQIVTQRNFVRGASATGTAISVNVPVNLSITNDAYENLTDGIRFYESAGSRLTGIRMLTISGNCIAGQLVNPSAGVIEFSTGDLSSCGTAILTDGRFALQITNTVTGTGNTIAYNITNGGWLRIHSSATLTGTTEISHDGTAYTLAAFRALATKEITGVGSQSRISEP